MASQTEEMDRVSGVISGHILKFREKTGVGVEFHAADLRNYVIAHEPHVAPASPDRILRDLRKTGQLSYVVVNRSKSLYRFV